MDLSQFPHDYLNIHNIIEHVCIIILVWLYAYPKFSYDDLNFHKSDEPALWLSQIMVRTYPNFAEKLDRIRAASPFHPEMLSESAAQGWGKAKLK